MMSPSRSSFLGCPENSKRCLIYHLYKYFQSFFLQREAGGCSPPGSAGSATKRGITEITSHHHYAARLPSPSVPSGLRQAVLLLFQHGILPAGKMPTGSQQTPLLCLVLKSNCPSVGCVILLFIRPPMCWPVISPLILRVNRKVRCWCDPGSQLKKIKNHNYMF